MESAAEIRVLHVDDEQDFTDLVATFLERAGDEFHVQTAPSPEAGLELLAEHEFDCIISEYDMPRTNGLEFLEAVRERDADLPFVLYTGKGSEEVASEAISAGVTDYLQKEPNTDHYDVLVNSVRNAVSQHRATKAADRVQRRLRELAEKTNDVLWMFSADWEELLFINSAYEELWGQDVDRLRDNSTAFLEAIHPEDRERARDAMEDLVDGTPQELELRVNPAEAYQRHVWIQAEPIFDDAGTVVRLVGFGRDITDRKEREQRYTAIFDQTYQFTGLLEPDGTLIEANETALTFGGLDREDVVGKKMWEAAWFQHSPETRERAREAVNRAAEGEFVRHELPVQGDERDAIIDFSVRPITDQDGNISLLIPEGRDITDRKEREAELERTRAFFREAERLGSLGAWEYDSRDGLTWTDGTRRIHEVEADFEPSLEEALEFVPPPDRDRIEAALETALEDGDAFDLEARLTTASDTERWIRVRGNLVAAGDPTIVRGFVQDITTEKERERDLERANSQLENAIEAGAVGTWEWNIPEDKLIVGKEFARRFGVEPDVAQEGVELERFISSIHPDDRARVEAAIERALETCGEYHVEYRVRDADDERNWVLARGHVDCNEEGSPRRFPGVLVDISDQKQAERELARQNARLNEFTSVLSHDLRNPLSVAKTRLELATADCASDHHEYIASAHDRMESLIDDMLTLARDREATVELEPIRFSNLLENCWANVETGDATLKNEVDRAIRADRSRVKQVFENLLRNAVEHCEMPVTVSVGTLEHGFYVEDDGPGIPEERRDDVFEVGYSTASTGTGFGLTIVEQVVDSHDWDIHLTEGEAGGARFEITGVEFVED